MSAVETSSAVPVLPATVTPGIAAAAPVPPLDDGDHHVAHLRGDLGADRALARRAAAGIRGLMRTPPLAIVAPTEAIPSGVARSLFWPIALAPTASASLRSAALGIVFGLGRGNVGRLVEAEALGGGDQLLGAELGADRPEDRVAGVREGGA